jgi:hypothetical protein
LICIKPQAVQSPKLSSMALSRMVVLFVALLAFSAAVASSICDVEHIQADCSLSLDQAPPAAADVTVPGAKAPAVACAAPPQWRAEVLRIAIPVERPPLSRPYFARSTRILG